MLCYDCGQDFANLKVHVKAELKKLNPIRYDLIKREFGMEGYPLTDNEHSILSHIDKRVTLLIQSI